ncbi:MAG: hypothetical protein RLZZ524_1180, partial [Pseudomonadota bacterium]
MDVKLKPFNFAEAATRAGMPQVAQRVRDSAQAAGLSGGVPGAVGRGQGVDRTEFSQVFSNALRGVSNEQKQASSLQREVALDNP